MKKVIIYITVTIMGIFITSFVSEKSYREIKNLYEVGDPSLETYLMVQMDDDNNTDLMYNTNNNLVQLYQKNEYSETFEYNAKNQLSIIRRYQDNKLIDLEQLSWNKDQIVKVDFDLVEGEIIEKYKEEFVVNYSGEITSITGYVKDPSGTWINDGTQLKLFWEDGVLNKIESWNNFVKAARKKIPNITNVEKLDIYNDIERSDKSYSSKKNSTFTLYSTTKFDHKNISNPLNYLTKGLLVWPDNSNIHDNAKIIMHYSDVNKNRFQEIYSYSFNVDTYPIKVETSRVKKIGNRTFASNISKQYSYEAN